MNPILITNPTNIRYLTGFVGVSPEEREAYCLLTVDAKYLFTNALYVEQAKKLKNVKVVEISRENPLSKELAKLTKKLSITKLGFEDVNLTVAELTKLKQELTGVELVPTRDTIETKRMIKRDDEIENIRQATKITDDCFSFILPKLTPGVEESDIAWEIETFFQKQGAQDAFSPIVAFGKNSSQPHYNPTPTGPFDSAQGEQSGILQKNDVALFDFGARVNGYCADMTRVVFIGKPKDEWVRAYNTVLKAHQTAIGLLRKYFDVSIHESIVNESEKRISGAKLDEVARDVIMRAGLPPYPHSLGHAVGLDIHEAPRLSYKKDAILKSNMVITIEPGVYVEGQYGIRIEDLVLLKDKTVEILSKSKKEIIIV